jgi:hypothetical protein
MFNVSSNDAAGVVARRGSKLTERLPRADTAVRLSERGGHPALERPSKKSRKLRVTARHSVHAAYGRMVGEHEAAPCDG